MTRLIAASMCIVFAVLGAQSATGGPRDNPNFGYDEQGKPHRDLMEFRRKRGHGGGQSPAHKPRKNGCQNAPNPEQCAKRLHRLGLQKQARLSPLGGSAFRINALHAAPTGQWR